MASDSDREVKPIEYDLDGVGNIIPPDAAPFDGEPVLIKLASGWCEARWEPGSKTETENGTEYEGFCWVCMDADFQAELDDARFWCMLPIEPTAQGGSDLCGGEPVAWMSKPGGACTSEKSIAEIWENHYGINLVPLYATPISQSPAGDQERIRDLIEQIDRLHFHIGVREVKISEMEKALKKVRSYNVDIAAGRINYRPHDHIQVIDDAIAALSRKDAP